MTGEVRARSRGLDERQPDRGELPLEVDVPGSHVDRGAGMAAPGRWRAWPGYGWRTGRSAMDSPPSPQAGPIPRQGCSTDASCQRPGQPGAPRPWRLQRRTARGPGRRPRPQPASPTMQPCLTPPGQAAVHRPTGFDIDQHRSVDPSFTCGVLIDTNHPRGRDFRFGQRAEQPQHRAATGGHPKARAIRAPARPAKTPDRSVDHTKIDPGHFGHLPEAPSERQLLLSPRASRKASQNRFSRTRPAGLEAGQMRSGCAWRCRSRRVRGSCGPCRAGCGRILRYAASVAVEVRGVVVLGPRGAQLPDGLSVWPDR
ncbi:hypothetical protein M2158_004848 [Streptomyces sp. SAI-144]|nr:hypothetical protein [Streptomyces sp. SAI-144]